jgi:lactoylglutathione lyase
MKTATAILLVAILLAAFTIKPKQNSMETKFAYTILYVKDVKKSIEFYEMAFGFTRKFVSPENDYGELLVGETTLSFASTTLAKSNLENGFIESSLTNKPFGIEIAFTTKDVEATVKSSIKAGAILVAEPKAKPWGQIVAYVRDHDGFLIEICTPLN